MWERMVPVLLAAGTAASAQVADPPSAPPTSEAPIAAAAADPLASYDLAFTQLDERMTVPVQIAGAGPYRFVIDTGAQRTVISRELAGTLGLPSGRNIRLTAMTGTSHVNTVVIPSVSVSTLGGRDIEAPALDARNLGAPGMLGIDSLQGHSLGIDFDRQVMSVTPVEKRSRRRSHDPNEVVVRAKSLFGQLVVTDAYVDGVRVRVVLDTGSPVSVGNEALRRRVASRTKKGPLIELISVTGESLMAPYGSVSRIRLGTVTLNHLPVAFADVKPFQQFGLEKVPAMLLGMDALKLFRRVDIDFANREVRMLLPRNVLIDPATRLAG